MFALVDTPPSGVMPDRADRKIRATPLRKPNSAKADATKADATKADATKADATSADATKADAAKADATKADAAKADTTNADATKVDATKAVPPIALLSRLYRLNNLLKTQTTSILLFCDRKLMSSLVLDLNH